MPDPIARDVRRQARWGGFKDAVRAGRVADAARFPHTSTRDRYRAQPARLSPAALAAIEQHRTTIQLVEIGFGGAQYERPRLRGTEIPAWGKVRQVEDDELVVDYTRTDEDEERLREQGAVVVDVMRTRLPREDLRRLRPGR